MKRYLTTLIFTFILLFTFPSACFAEVTIVYPFEGAILTSRNINFQWKNTDSVGEYTYLLELGPAAVSTDVWMPSVGVSVPGNTSKEYIVPTSFGDVIMWRVKYCLKEQNPCEHVLSSTTSEFTIVGSNQPIIEQTIPEQVSAVKISTPTTVSKNITKKISNVAKQEPASETIVWNVNTSQLSKPFSFPFKEYIGVTQWHGNTAFQKPHTGIDFGAVKKEILAIGDGEVIAKGWDSYNGKCLSGGNYILIKLNNGMYSSYFHLQDTYVDVGMDVKKGTVLGISGNTGSWNCQPLAYHLHFETRTGRSQSTHVNPVDYIATDWSKVLTLNFKSNSGRLSGDNPHPTY